LPKLLIVDDEKDMRDAIRLRLRAKYELIDTGDASEGLMLALQHKPDCILLDLMMPKFTGFELCQTLSSVATTRMIPIIVISNKPAAEYETLCLNLGATKYFEKPIDFTELEAALAKVMANKQVERRAEVRARLKVILKIKGTNAKGKQFEFLAVSEDVSANGFSCMCTEILDLYSSVDVFLVRGGIDYHGGVAKVARVQWVRTPAQTYGFHFTVKPIRWIM
jgi:DNA-binding response OmpR family regulator